jgi:FkbM family methyltransferase
LPGRREKPTDSLEEKRVETLEKKVDELTRTFDAEVLKVLRKGYAAGPLVQMGYPGADLKLVAAAQGRKDEHESEPYISEWIERCFADDEVFYDIGANVGTYSLIAASVALRRGHIYAFEPAFSAYAVLCENVFVNGLGDRITTLPVALGATTGLETFRYSSLRPVAAKHNWPTGPVAYTHRVLTYRLDDLVRQLNLPLPHHIKIDVDGGEPDLLRGATEILSSPSLRSLIVELLTWTKDAVVAELAAHELALLYTYERPPSPVTCGLFARSDSQLIELLGLHISSADPGRSPSA